MAKTLTEVRNPNDAGHITDHEFAARLVNELYGTNVYAPAAGATVNPDVALGGVHEITLPVGNVTIGPVTTSDAAGGIQRYNTGQRIVLVLTQPAAGGSTVTWDASWRRTTSGIDTRANAVTTFEFVNDAAAGAAPQWRRVAEAATALESVRVWHTDAASPATVIQGAAAQSTDLTRWQSSSGAVVARVDQVGSLTARLAAFAAGAAGEVPLTVSGAASQTGDLTQWRNSAAAVLAKVDAAGVLTAAGIATAGALTVTGGGVHAIVGSLTETGSTVSQPASAAQVPQVMKGFASQTGDLTQWQNSTGAVLARIDSNGAVYAPAAFLGTMTYLGARLSAVPNNASEIGAIFRGFASQTADLQQWQDSTGAVKASVFPDGRAWFGGSVAAVGTGSQLTVTSGAVGRVGISVQLASAGTADIQQWQNNVGSALARVDSAGTVIANNLTVNPTSATGDAAERFMVNGVMKGAVVAPGSAGAWCGTANVGDMVIRSESGHIWYANSGGTPLGVVRSDGTQIVHGSSTDGAAFFVWGNTNATNDITVRHAGTGNYTVWQNSAGTGVAFITNTGNVQGTGAYTTLSDAAAKANVRGLVHDPLDVIRRLKPRHYDYRDGGPFGGERDQVGFVAQEVQAVLPQAVTAFDGDRLGTRSEAIVAYLVAAVQELDRRLAAAA